MKSRRVPRSAGISRKRDGRDDRAVKHLEGDTTRQASNRDGMLIGRRPCMLGADRARGRPNGCFKREALSPAGGPRGQREQQALGGAVCCTMCKRDAPSQYGCRLLAPATRRGREAGWRRWRS